MTVTATWLRHALWVVLPFGGLGAAQIALRELSSTGVFFDTLTALLAVGLALLAWELRPRGSSAVLLVVFTAWYLIRPVTMLSGSFWTTAGWLLDATTAAFVVHAVLGYPRGLTDRAARVVVALAYVVTAGGAAAELAVGTPDQLYGCPPAGCPSVPPYVHADSPLFRGIVWWDARAQVAVATAFVLLLALRCRRASRREPRSLLPLAAATTVVAGWYAVELLTNLDSTLIDDVLRIVLAGAFLLGALDDRAQRAELASALVGLARSADPSGLPAILGQAVHDPGLRVGAWDPAAADYRDVSDADLFDGVAGERTPVTSDAGVLGVIVHDPSIGADPGLLAAMQAATRLALDNARLAADLRARIGQLRQSRQRLLRATDEARYRLERDLHDGAQQRLLGVGMLLELAGTTPPGPALSGTLHEARTELAAAVQELRDLARGIHPALLSDLGLGAAVRAYVSRSPVPVTVIDRVTERPEPAIETAAYFVVCEALQNAVKHAAASMVSVALTSDEASLVVTVHDDGRGGARVTAGGGLSGLVDRAEALDGRLTMRSEPGGGTTVEARLPCGS